MNTFSPQDRLPLEQILTYLRELATETRATGDLEAVLKLDNTLSDLVTNTIDYTAFEFIAREIAHAEATAQDETDLAEVSPLPDREPITVEQALDVLKEAIVDAYVSNDGEVVVDLHKVLSGFTLNVLAQILEVASRRDDKRAIQWIVVTGNAVRKQIRTDALQLVAKLN